MQHLGRAADLSALDKGKLGGGEKGDESPRVLGHLGALKYQTEVEVD